METLKINAQNTHEMSGQFSSAWWHNKEIHLYSVTEIFQFRELHCSLPKPIPQHIFETLSNLAS